MTRRVALAAVIACATTAFGCVQIVQRPLAVPPIAARYEAEETVRVTREGATRVLHGPFTIQQIDGRIFLDAADGSLASVPLDGTQIARDVEVVDHSSDWLWYVLGVVGGSLVGVLAAVASTQ